MIPYDFLPIPEIKLPMRCATFFFSRHTWGKWSEPFTVGQFTDTALGYVEHSSGSTMQQRQCEICGKIKVRKIMGRIKTVARPQT
jgi:hypothetical protein